MQKAYSGLNLFQATLAITLVTAMTVFDATIANVAIPTIAGNLAAAGNQATWVITFFCAANAALIPVAGVLAKRFGELRVFTFSLVIFVLASATCAVSSNLNFLLASRVIQGAAAGPLMPLSQSILLKVWPREKAQMALAIWSMVAVVAPILGPIAGGYICEVASWPFIFLINIPIGVISLFLLLTTFKEEIKKQPESQISIPTCSFLSLMLLMCSLQFFLDRGKDLDWFASFEIRILFLVVLISLASFCYFEANKKTSIINKSIFRIKSYAIGTFFCAVGFAIYFASVVLTPLTLQKFYGYTAFWAGVAVAPVGVVPFLIAPFLGSQKLIPNHAILPIGFIVLAIGLAARATGLADVITLKEVIVWQLVIGAGLSFFFLPVTSISMKELSKQQLKEATSYQTSIRVLAGSVLSSLVSTFWERWEIVTRSRFVEELGIGSYHLELAREMSAISNSEAFFPLLEQEIQKVSFLVSASQLFYLGSLLSIICAILSIIWAISMEKSECREKEKKIHNEKEKEF